jgi:hypothetical protein
MTKTLIVPPLALVRCSRGGKTRALKEIAKEFKTSHDDTCVIFVSFNDDTSINVDETADPLSALCQRIAYANLKDQNMDFFQFRKKNFLTFESLISWLANKDCLLLIDELNNIEMEVSFAMFLKQNFLKSRGRYLVFSSHIYFISTQLVDFMESSSREVIVSELPLIPSISVALESLRLQNLGPHQAVYFGLMLALIYTFSISNLVEKRAMTIELCRPLLTNEAVIALLRSFIVGDAKLVFPPLLQLMNTTSHNMIRWIPCHMAKVLSTFANSPSCFEKLHGNLRSYLLSIVRFFSIFYMAKNCSDDSWESLFMIVLLIRCVTHTFDSSILNLRTHFQDASISYNFCLKNPSEFNKSSFVKLFVQNIAYPKTFPHISIYYPSHVNFEIYDVIVVAWDGPESKLIIGFQLKSGKDLASQKPLKEFEVNFVIKG